MQFRPCLCKSLFAVRLANIFVWERVYGRALKYKSITFDLTPARSVLVINKLNSRIPLLWLIKEFITNVKKFQDKQTLEHCYLEKKADVHLVGIIKNSSTKETKKILLGRYILACTHRRAVLTSIRGISQCHKISYCSKLMVTWAEQLCFLKYMTEWGNCECSLNTQDVN